MPPRPISRSSRKRPFSSMPTAATSASAATIRSKSVRLKLPLEAVGCVPVAAPTDASGGGVATGATRVTSSAGGPAARDAGSTRVASSSPGACSVRSLATTALAIAGSSRPSAAIAPTCSSSARCSSAVAAPRAPSASNSPGSVSRRAWKSSSSRSRAVIGATRPSILQPHDHGGNVVARGALQRQVEQARQQHRRVGKLAAFAVELLVAQLLVDAVGTEQELRAGAVARHHPVHEQALLGAHRAAEHTGAGLRRRRAAAELSDIVLGAVHVVAGDLAQLAVLVAVGAAVAHPAAQHEVLVVQQQHHGGADDVAAALQRGGDQVGVDLLQAILDRLDEIEHAAG